MKGYESSILCMHTSRTKLLIVIFVAMENSLPWQQRDISISQLSEGVEGPDLIKLTVDLRSNFGVWLLG